MKPKNINATTCEVCGHEKVGVRVCEVLDPASWRATKVRACQPCRAKRKLTPVQYHRTTMTWA